MTSSEIKQRLFAHVESFCGAWLAGGRKHGTEWRCGDIFGNPAKAGKSGSFVVRLGGKYQGTWYENDQSSPQRKGSLVDVIMAQRSVEFIEAIKIAADWLGVQYTADAPGGFKRAAYAPAEPAAPLRPKVEWYPIADGSAAMRYLESRGLDKAVVHQYWCGMGDIWFRETQKPVPAVTFPAFDATGKTLLMAKHMAVQRVDGAKVVRANKGAEYHLIGMHVAEALRKDKPGIPLVITEGEVDMLTHAMHGYAAVSVPFGAKADGENGEMNKGNVWIDNDWAWLETWEDIILALDGDATGRAATQTLLRRLGPERCRIAQFPDDPATKDANGMMEADPDAYVRIMDDAAPVDPDALRRARDFATEIWDELWPKDEESAGVPCPWDDTGKFPFRWRMGEVTAWQGYTKHGKTTLLNFCLVHFASHGHSSCIASLEIKARKTLRNIMRMAIGASRPANPHTQEPDKAWFDRAMRWMDRHFFIYDKVGETTIEDVLSVWRYAARRHGVKHFVLDSLMKLDVNEEDYPAVKGVLNALTAFAREYDVAVHLVTHSKKPTEKRPEAKYWPDKYQISGSASISNIPHNVVCVYRHLAKEQKMEQRIAEYQTLKQSGGTPGQLAELEREIDAMEKIHDAMFIVQAQREGDGSLPIMQLFFDKGHSWQYLRHFDQPVKVYVK